MEYLFKKETEISNNTAVMIFRFDIFPFEIWNFPFYSKVFNSNHPEKCGQIMIARREGRGAEVYLEHSRTSTMELFLESS